MQKEREWHDNDYCNRSPQNLSRPPYVEKQYLITLIAPLVPLISCVNLIYSSLAGLSGRGFLFFFKRGAEGEGEGKGNRNEKPSPSLHFLCILSFFHFLFRFSSR